MKGTIPRAEPLQPMGQKWGCTGLGLVLGESKPLGRHCGNRYKPPTPGRLRGRGAEGSPGARHPSQAGSLQTQSAFSQLTTPKNSKQNHKSSLLFHPGPLEGPATSERCPDTQSHSTHTPKQPADRGASQGATCSTCQPTLICSRAPLMAPGVRAA